MTMNNDSNRSQSELSLAKERQRDSLYAGLVLGVSGIGFIAISLFAQFGLLGTPTPQLLSLGLIALIFSLSQIPVRYLGNSGRGFAATLLAMFIMSVFAIIIVYFWDGIALITVAIILLTYTRTLLSGIPRRILFAALAIKAVGIAGIYLADQNPFILINRLQFNTPAAIAGLAFAVATAVLLITVNVTANSHRYSNLRNQLLMSFIIIVTVPTLLAIILSAVGNYVNVEAQMLRTLETVSSLKENQIERIIDSFRVTSVRISEDPEFLKSAYVLLDTEQTDDTALDFARTNARSYLSDLITSQGNNYAEIMLLNLQGEVKASSVENNEGKGFLSEKFFREGLITEYTGFSKNPIFGDSNLVYSIPVSDSSQTIQGVLVMRANSRLVKDVIESTPSFSEMESYLLDANFFPLTDTRRITQTVRTQASESVLTFNISEPGRGTYESYTGDTVLGYYKRFGPMKDTAFIAEVPRSVALNDSIDILVSSSALAAIAILIAIAAVLISAESIANPIRALAATVTRFAEGKHRERVEVERLDEIGTLGYAYNQMARQLQEFIGQLERRVAERTADLETARLLSEQRAQDLQSISEISRAISLEQRLEILLPLVTRLVSERFEFYHVGIFFLDESRRYAYLQAANSEGGQRMLARSHRLEVGTGLVGTVVQTAKPRIALDVGADAVFFNNPDLPNTRSEMALPLNVRGRTIGVLDVQSTSPGAFTENDANTLGVLADQIAIAIENARLFNQIQLAREEAEALYTQIQRQEWNAFVKQEARIGYRQTATGGRRLAKPVETDEIRHSLRSGETLVTKTGTRNTNPMVIVPIKLRGQTIGILNIKGAVDRDWNIDELDLIQSVTDRMALALENARLFEETTKRAERERLVSEITGKIRSHNDPQAIIDTALQELRNALGASRVDIIPKTNDGKDTNV